MPLRRADEFLETASDPASVRRATDRLLPGPSQTVRASAANRLLRVQTPTGGTNPSSLWRVLRIEATPLPNARRRAASSRRVPAHADRPGRVFPTGTKP